MCGRELLIINLAEMARDYTAAPNTQLETRRTE
jgi:hypothetical protein